MTLVKTSLLNSITVTVRVGSALLLNKILAIYVGPSGYALIGQFQNVVSIIVNVGGGVVATGVTKTTAQHFDDEAKQHAVWQTAIRFSLCASLVAGATILLFHDNLAQWLLHTSDMSGVFIWLALTLPTMAANNLLLAVINGKKEVGIYVTSNILGSFISVLVTGLLAFKFGLYGALVAFTISPAIVLLSTGAFVARRYWFKVQFFWGAIDRRSMRELSGFGLMSLTSALAIPITTILIRNNLTKNLGLTAAGYWQAAWKISDIYLLLVTATLSLYYLPRLAEIRTAHELKVEIIKVYRFVIPLVITSAVMIYLLRDVIINILFTPDFLAMRELFPWQLTGDVIKISSWILGYILIGRAMVKLFMITEIAFSISFVLLSWLLVNHFGLVGVSMAFAINYCFHWACMFYLTVREMRRMVVMHG